NPAPRPRSDSSTWSSMAATTRLDGPVRSIGVRERSSYTFRIAKNWFIRLRPMTLRGSRHTGIGALAIRDTAANGLLSLAMTCAHFAGVVSCRALQRCAEADE